PHVHGLDSTSVVEREECGVVIHNDCSRRIEESSAGSRIRSVELAANQGRCRVTNHGGKTAESASHIGTEFGPEDGSLSEIPNAVGVIQQTVNRAWLNSECLIEVGRSNTRFEVTHVAEVAFHFEVVIQVGTRLQPVNTFVAQLRGRIS